MSKKAIVLCLVAFLICIVIAVWIWEKSPNRVVVSENRVASERFIIQIDFNSSSWIRESFTVSPDSKRVACVARVGDKQFVVVDGEEGKKYDVIGKGTPIFSLDSKRVAYRAHVGGERVAYVGWLGGKWFAVVDGEEGKSYDGIVTLGGGKIIFDSPDSLHYLALKGSNSIYLVEGSIYLVEERIK